MVMPSKTGQTIVVRIDGKFMAWTDGHISGDKELVRQAKENASISELVRFPRRFAQAELSDANNPTGAIAAMWGISPGRASVEEGYPELIIELFGGVEPDPGR